MDKNTIIIPSSFSKNILKELNYKTPFFIFSKEVLINNFNEYLNSFPKGTEICYSMKANSEKSVLKTLNEIGSSFEVASKYELALLKPLKILADKILYGSSVKAADHIQEFVRYGVDRFACDSEPELLKIAKFAPGAKIYIRTLVDDRANSVFHMLEKFGVSIEESIRLMIKAKELGLVPYGMSFNVGSQARNEFAWGRGIADIATAMRILLKNQIKIEIINIGGGFPNKYRHFDHTPSIAQVSKHINNALKKLPYPVKLIAEPGRGLVAKSYLLMVSVTERINRHNGNWLHLDAGVYNALLEALAYQGSIRYKIETLKTNSNSKKRFILTGPACDDLDVIEENALLPKDVQVGDKLIIYDTGAYTFTLMTRFNGFPKPQVVQY